MANPLRFLTLALGVRRGTEEPAHTVADRVGDVEIRRYGPRLAAETTVAADTDTARGVGFRRLAGFIFGGNHPAAATTAPVATQRTSIAMTAPVAQSAADGGSVIGFFMPARWTRDTLPVPDDDAVRVVEVPAQTMAVLRFRGDRSPGAIAARTEQLREALAGTGYRVTGDPVSWLYDPPFTLPFRRRNEVALPVTG